MTNFRSCHLIVSTGTLVCDSMMAHMIFTSILVHSTFNSEVAAYVKNNIARNELPPIEIMSDKYAQRNSSHSLVAAEATRYKACVKCSTIILM